MKNLKRIKGYKKSKHFVERQEERSISDEQVKLILSNGKTRENEDGYILYIFNQFTVVTDPWAETLITVHAEGHLEASAKIISFQKALEIKQHLEQTDLEALDINVDVSNEFYQNMHRERVEALSEVEDDEEGEIINIEEYLQKKKSA